MTPYEMDTFTYQPPPYIKATKSSEAISHSSAWKMGSETVEGFVLQRIHDFIEDLRTKPATTGRLIFVPRMAATQNSRMLDQLLRKVGEVWRVDMVMGLDEEDEEVFSSEEGNDRRAWEEIAKSVTSCYDSGRDIPGSQGLLCTPYTTPANSKTPQGRLRYTDNPPCPVRIEAAPEELSFVGENIVGLVNENNMIWCLVVKIWI